MFIQDPTFSIPNPGLEDPGSSIRIRIKDFKGFQLQKILNY